MGRLAIKGHATRGKEVIELLEMLGGKQFNSYNGNNIGWCYTIINGSIKCDYPSHKYKLFSLEEFLAKYPYKVGDKVIYKPLMPEIDVDVVGEIIAMSWYNYLDNVVYTTSNSHVMFAEDFQPYKEETMKEIHIHKIGFNGDKAKLVLCNDYEFETEGKEVYVVKKQPQYPKTYDECCNMYGADCATYSLETFKALRELIYCRNSYWKIAGEQMGLDKPWEPNWDSLDKKYSIYNYRGNILHDNFTVIDRCVLVFPTEEMRNAFYENFKDLIERCKELLC